MKRVCIGIAGFGTVGRATADILGKHAELIEQRTGAKFEVVAVCRRSSNRLEEIPRAARFVSDWKNLVCCSDVDVIVETMGGTDHALQLVQASLKNRKPVVTANKSLLAEHGDELFNLAAAQNVPIGFEASVAGGIPIVRAIQESSAGERLCAVFGILNGTANYILTEMENRDMKFEEAVDEAKKAGYAEADPSLDVDGFDARDKLCILARMAFDGRLSVSRIPTTGIREVRAIDTDFTRRLDGTIRLVGSAEYTDAGIELSVRPWMVNRQSMLAKVEGVNNAVFLRGSRIGTQLFYGRGAGGDATGAAIVSDLIEIGHDLAEGRMHAKRVMGFGTSRELRICSNPRPVRWYLRLIVKGQFWTVGSLTDFMARHGIKAVRCLVHTPETPNEPMAFAVTTEPISEPTMQRAVNEINTSEFMIEPILLVRIE